MKLIISLLLFISTLANSGVVIYKNGMSVIGLEQASKEGVFTSTLYGGSYDKGASSPADCTVKFKLEKNKKGFSGSLLPFSTELMGYSNAEKGDASFEFEKSGIIFTSPEPLSVCPMSTDFNGSYPAVNEGGKEFQSDFAILFQVNYQNAVENFHAGKVDVAISLLEPYMSESVKLNYYQPNIYNDYGYFLQQAGMNQEAIEYLNIVKNKSPKRVVVYLNIADAYWAIQKRTEATENYKKYITIMTTSGDSKDIPARATERSQ